ncbi:PMS1 protein homolog 1 [Aplysia californica]|uniref:PMS1 protein homolog 1 n=1 Tax=Aplysia californica TaxID=6500 RepID=A0ABM0JAW0_APLCA|nr:PMS1 protein homolog 1 [Aplysia californica]
MAPPSKIEGLPPSAVRLIGSGQVITSVFSVVKELIENSVDAGATAIDIKLDNYGLDRIEIIDNGCGVKVEDVPFMAKRHYTSKITSTDDLLSLHSYGFRGEALASLCSVADVTITTKTKTDDLSYTYTIDKEGNVSDRKPSHLGQGTTVCARNLFATLPVRRQYYNSSQRRKDDVKRVEEVLIAYGIIKPQLRITLKHGKDLIWQKATMNDSKAVLQHVLGRQIVNSMLNITRELETPKVSLTVFIPKAGTDVKAMSRSSSDRTFLVVNNRPVHVKEFVKVLRQYYDNCHACESVRHPICYVSVTLPTQEVDVNVDPNKTTVFLQNMHEVRNLLEEILLEVYGPLENVPSWHYAESAPPAGKQTRADEEDGSRSHNVKRQPCGLLKADSRKSSQDQTDIQHRNYSVARGENSSPCIVDDNKEDDLSNGMSHKRESLDSDLNHNRQESLTCAEKTNTSVEASNRAGQQSDSVEAAASVNMTSENEILLDDFDSEAFFKDLLSEEVEGTGVNDSSKTDATNATSCSLSNMNENLAGSSNSSVPSETACGVLTLNTQVDPAGGENLAPSEGSAKEATVVSADSWSRGQGLGHCDGTPVQPVRLLCPTSRQVPGKRPLSPSAEPSPGPSKSAKLHILPPNQMTLHDVVGSSGDGGGTSPVTPFTHYCKEQRMLKFDLFSSQSEEEVTQTLKAAWMKLSNDDRVKYRDDHWQDVQRRRKEMEAKSKQTSNSKKAQVNVRDEVADLASQSQAKKTKKVLKNRLYNAEKLISFSLKQVKDITESHNQEGDRANFPDPRVIGSLQTCDVWAVVLSSQLSLVNAQRLSEMLLYKKLTNEHKLQATPCTVPVSLDARNVGEDLWPTLEELAQKNHAGENIFHITDERVTANGFDVKCCTDANGKLEAELAGVCDLIPTYNISDFSEVLRNISKQPSAPLGQMRPLKVQYYLQGEAVRMVLQLKASMSATDLENSLCDLNPCAADVQCIHHRPVFHSLFDLSTL